MENGNETHRQYKYAQANEKAATTSPRYSRCRHFLCSSLIYVDLFRAQSQHKLNHNTAAMRRSFFLLFPTRLVNCWLPNSFIFIPYKLCSQAAFGLHTHSQHAQKHTKLRFMSSYVASIGFFWFHALKLLPFALATKMFSRFDLSCKEMCCAFFFNSSKCWLSHKFSFLIVVSNVSK